MKTGDCQQALQLGLGQLSTARAGPSPPPPTLDNIDLATLTEYNATGRRFLISWDPWLASIAHSRGMRFGLAKARRETCSKTHRHAQAHD